MMTKDRQITRNILAFPQGWQRPAKTEEWAYECCLADFPENKFAQMFCFPWATLIDLQRKGKSEQAKRYQDALRWALPRTTLVRATVCQHIYTMDMLPWFKQLKITDIFWSHATNRETQIEGIRIHPFPLYPVCAAEADSRQGAAIPPGKRRYLYSFIGAYEPGLYLTEARRWIFALPPRDDAYIERRSEWHFEGAVYGEQIGGTPQSQTALQAQRLREHQYTKVLSQSVFSLCPSGSGPNSIRLWESLGFGCIPVILSDALRLPGELSLWQDSAVFAPESSSAIGRLPDVLKEMAMDRSLLEKMQASGKRLWQLYGAHGALGGFITKTIEERIREHC
jgi:hypothetical protein